MGNVGVGGLPWSGGAVFWVVVMFCCGDRCLLFLGDLEGLVLDTTFGPSVCARDAGDGELG
ncbi:hypothetical protein P171DRAFT_113458 [Karstenula rhodostoma CBS 690.94]|uniref:Uncharacterized protein n=1 Tax=Karstenula rhodostoma CBS 690.94 TaxID=1392251 RepID=A0A9P4PAH8_9PLEO|nr:hypothetical protein P171DRAFT_113458 [Karstenula rhodostoma CBS 690.94]